MLQIVTPDAIYGDLFEAVQASHLFEDSKTFVDAAPRKDPASILEDYQRVSKAKAFDLESFVRANFDLPDQEAQSLGSNGRRPLRQQIDRLWDHLTRDADQNDHQTSLIALPHPYVVPGGRFREIYYWDSYFTMLGLAASGRTALVQNMVDNFAFLIDEVGFIPNGNRTYFCTRSQPPLFVLMVKLLASVKKDPTLLAAYLPQLEKEYRFWMSGAEGLQNHREADRRIVRVNGSYLNRYWDDSDLPRQESYAEDISLAHRCDRDPADLYRDIRSACESGWDFSSRWLTDGRNMAAIQASRIVPIDLNAIMHELETTLGEAHRLAGDGQNAARYDRLADRRKSLIQSLFFDEKRGFFVDLALPELSQGGRISLAAAFPLFFRLATNEQAERVAERIEADFLRPGGWVTTPMNTGQQWDAPNGWAPLQWIVYSGLCRYGFSKAAKEGAGRWVANNCSVYRNTGKLLEKYDVEDVGRFAGGGEYLVQDGFGWTNGVLLSLMDELGVD